MATLRRLQAFECTHRRRPISSSTHSRFQQPSCWLHSLLKNRPGQGLSSNSHGSIIHCEDSRDNAIWPVGVSPHALWIKKKTLPNRSNALWMGSYATCLSHPCTSMTSWLLAVHPRITYNTSATLSAPFHEWLNHKQDQVCVWFRQAWLFGTSCQRWRYHSTSRPDSRPSWQWSHKSTAFLRYGQLLPPLSPWHCCRPRSTPRPSKR